MADGRLPPDVAVGLRSGPLFGTVKHRGRSTRPGRPECNPAKHLDRACGLHGDGAVDGGRGRRRIPLGRPAPAPGNRSGLGACCRRRPPRALLRPPVRGIVHMQLREPFCERSAGRLPGGLCAGRGGRTDVSCSFRAFGEGRYASRVCGCDVRTATADDRGPRGVRVLCPASRLPSFAVALQRGDAGPHFGLWDPGVPGAIGRHGNPNTRLRF